MNRQHWSGLPQRTTLPRSARSSRRSVPSVRPVIVRIACNKRGADGAGPGRRRAFRPALFLALAAGLLAGLAAPVLAQGNAERGRLVANAAGCVSCHTDYEKQGQPYAG